jgi:hypothetical protein
MSNIGLRIDKSGPNSYTTFYSPDGGASWTQIAAQTATFNNAKLAIQEGTDQTSTFPTVDLAWVEIVSQDPTPPPTLTGVTPNTGAAGQNNLGIALTGTNFLTSPTCALGAGITVNSCTFISPTQITANISIASNASIGTRNVTVTNNDGQSATVTGGFSVQASVVYPAPTLTSANPNSGLQAQSNLVVLLAGTNFLPAPVCSFGPGVTVNSCTYNSSTQLVANVSIAANATVGTNTITITNTDGQMAVLGNAFTINFNPNPFVPTRVNSGGIAYTDTQGRVWTMDNGFTGGASASTTSSIANTPDPTLYRSERYGNFTYQFAVPNGSYDVGLKFAEIYWTTAGKRIFNVSINGTQVLSNFDIVAAAGAAFTAVDKTFPTTVANGAITIQFTSGSADLPKVSAIQITLRSGVSVQVSPATASLYASQSKQFTAIVTGSTNTGVTWSLTPQTGTLTANGLYTAPLSVTSPQTLKVTATSQADPTQSAAATVSLLPPAGSFAPISVDSGSGAAYTDTLGTVWSADTAFAGGQVASTSTTITNTPDPVLYQTERYGASSYSFTVPAGSYSVTLKFAEIYFTSAGKRIFNVSINGTPVLTNFDIVATTGSAFKALDKTFPVTVTGNSISVQFTTGSADLPKVSAIQIKQASGVGIQINPTTATLLSSQSQQFAATVTGTGNVGVSWSYSPQVGTLATSGPNAGLYTAPASVTTNQTVQVTATSVADTAQTSTAQVSLVPPFSQILVNAGGPVYTDGQGQVWSADKNFTGGNTATTAKAISNTTEPTLYQSERYGGFTYQFAVANGTYNVVLKFAEIYWTTTGKRIFNVSINGTQVLSNFDIVAAAGGAAKAIDKTFPVTVTNNQITIQFIPGSADLPKVSAIQIH